jgi:hypothetical protein
MKPLRSNTELKISPHWGVDFRPLAAYVNRDAMIEAKWRANVAKNPKEIARLARNLSNDK